jgi:hypothetical protein
MEIGVDWRVVPKNERVWVQSLLFYFFFFSSFIILDREVRDREKIEGIEL